MKRKEIENQVKKIIKDYLGEVEYAHCGEITGQCNLRNIGVDNFGFLYLTWEIENNFNIQVSRKDEKAMETIDGIVDMVYNKIN
ncbi:MAG: acyl carrier protein [Alphaproteobacteria bacterium]|nr:acyl carrier protein [Alphaproteobacteria bacterium]